MFQTGEFFARCLSPLYFEHPVRGSIHRFKFRGCQSYCFTYGPILADCIASHYAGQYDILSWVPVSSKRRRTRGYDQAELLARSTAQALGVPLVATLFKVKDTPPQSSLTDRARRRANISGAYTCLDPAQIVGQRILLIDDVVTTGSTFSESARCLLSAGADNVLCASLARVPEH